MSYLKLSKSSEREDLSRFLQKYNTIQFGFYEKPLGFEQKPQSVTISDLNRIINRLELQNINMSQIQNASKSFISQNFSLTTSQEIENQNVSGEQPSTNSSELIKITQSMIIHYPPFPENTHQPKISIRDKLIRRHQIYGDNFDGLVHFMEERLIRYRPPNSQHNVDNVLSGNHVFQKEFSIKAIKKKSVSQGSSESSSVSKLCSLFGKKGNVNCENISKNTINKIVNGKYSDNTTYPEERHISEDFEGLSAEQVSREYAAEEDTERTVHPHQRVLPEVKTTSTRKMENPTNIINALAATHKDIKILFENEKEDINYQDCDSEPEEDERFFCGLQWNTFWNTIEHLWGR